MSSLVIGLAFPSTVQWRETMEVLIVTVTAAICSGGSILSLTNQSMTCDHESRHVTAASELALITSAQTLMCSIYIVTMMVFSSSRQPSAFYQN